MKELDLIFEFINKDIFLIIVCGINILLLILYIVNISKLGKLRKSYSTFMRKIGNGNNIQETIEKYMIKIDEVKEENKQIQNYCKQLDNNLAKCIQKIGLVRYSAFKDTGSDLSFALALLDEQDNGVVLNGIYSREMSNIYSKPIENGKSTYTLSEEEKEALKKAIKI